MTGDALLIWLEINGDKLCNKIRNGNYDPMPLSGFLVAKTNGRPRTLSKLTAIDTIIQKAILNGLYQIVDADFSPSSFAYRKGKGVTDAIALYCQYGNNHPLAVKIDPVAYYDNIDRSVLHKMLQERFADTKLSDLIMRFIEVPILIEGELNRRPCGIPQGIPLSSLLANIYLDCVDKTLERMNVDFIRYADDIVIFVDSVDSGEECLEKVRVIFEKTLHLRLSQDKCSISSPIALSFLGCSFRVTRSGMIAEQEQSDSINYRWKTSKIPQKHNEVNLLSGGILRQKDYSLLFETESEKKNLPPKSLNAINVYSSVILDSGALKTAFDNKLLINVFSTDNKLLGRFVPNVPLKAPLLIFEQLSTYYDPQKRLFLSKQFVLASFHNTRIVIRYYNKQEPCSAFDSALAVIDDVCKEIKNIDSYETLLITEARGRNAYYSCFDRFLEGSSFFFNKRTRKPPQNEVNAMLSFGYTVLYNMIATSLYQSSLDIRIGFLHATNKRKESLNLDIAELFKPIVIDRTMEMSRYVQSKNSLNLKG